MPKRRKRYSNAQKRAYHSGQGYRAGRYGKRIKFKNKRNLASFRAGYRDAKYSVSRLPKV